MTIRESIRKALRVQESVMTTYYHDFYGTRTGIHNRIPICPTCRLPRVQGDQSGVGPERCVCQDYLDYLKDHAQS